MSTSDPSPAELAIYVRGTYIHSEIAGGGALLSVTLIYYYLREKKTPENYRRWEKKKKEIIIIKQVSLSTCSGARNRFFPLKVSNGRALYELRLTARLDQWDLLDFIRLKTTNL